MTDDRDLKIAEVHNQVCRAINVVKRDKSLKNDQERIDAIVKIVDAFFPDDLDWLEPTIIQIVKFAWKVHKGEVRIKNGCC